MVKRINPGLFLLLLPVWVRPGAAGTGDAALAQTFQRTYDRTASRVMVRTLRHTDRAALDSAAYERNRVFHYPLDERLVRPARLPAFGDLHFDGVLDAATLADEIAGTPLTADERARPLSWRPLLDHLCEWNYDASEGLLRAAAQISSRKWGNDDLIRPLQEIAAVYLHGNSLWARVDFRPELHWLPCSDSDGDGYREVYARIDSRRFGPAVPKAIRAGYLGKALTREDMEQAFYEIASAWYPSLMTVVLEPKQSRPWPTPDTEPEVRALFGDRRFAAPFVVLRSKPYGKTIYNVFLLPGAGPASPPPGAPGAPRVASSAIAARTTPITRSAAPGQRIADELARWGGGEWTAWLARLAEFHAAVRRKLDSRPKELSGLLGRDRFLFFRGDVEYLLSGDLRSQQDGRDPFPAIVDFVDQLNARRIACLFVVIPSKAEVYPDKFVEGAPPEATPYVAPYGRKLLAELAAAGVQCVDLLPAFIEHRYDKEGLIYMPQDTHWTPRGIELAAGLIAAEIKRSEWYAARGDGGVQYGIRSVKVRRLGDICGMLTDRERLGYRPLELIARQVVDPDGNLYEDSPDSPVVVLGDSFTGVFHFEDCRHAGLSAHLARELGLPVDLIMAHGSGPRIRGRLARRGAKELAAKRIVVWTVAARDLYDYWAPWARIKLP